VRADHVLLRLGLSADIAHLKGELGWAKHAHEMISWLLTQDAIWPSTHGRSGASQQTLDRLNAREELFGRIAARKLRPAPDSHGQDRDD
jgi:hypothetical protein